MNRFLGAVTLATSLLCTSTIPFAKVSPGLIAGIGLAAFFAPVNIQKARAEFPEGITERFQGYVTLPNGQEVWVDYIPPKPGKETIIMLNGLTYDTTNWDKLVNRMGRTLDEGTGILRYDMRGMGKTFQKNGPVTAPIPYEAQVEDLKLLIEKMKFERKPVLLGLSYGGGISLAYTKKYADTIEHTIAVAPYVRPLTSQDEQFKALIHLEEFLTGNHLSPKEFQARYSALLKLNVDTVYPLVEPGPWNPAAVFNLTEGIRVWNATLDAEIAKIPKDKITLIAAAFDEYVEYASLTELAEKLGPALRHFEIAFSRHKVPEENPALMNLIVRETLAHLYQESCVRRFRLLGAAS